MSARLFWVLTAAALMAALPRAGRADDELDKFVAQNRIVAQKIKTEAGQAIAQAKVLERTDPEQAQAILHKALRQVQNATALSAAEQTQLTGRLLSRIREVGEVARQQRVAQKQAPLNDLPKRPAHDTPAAGPASVAQKFIENSSAGVGTAARIQRESNKGFAGAVAGIDSSAIPISGDVTFPKDWAAKTELRKKYSGPQLTPKEVTLVKALNSVLSVDFNETPLKQVLEVLQDRTGQAIIVDPNSLKEANADYMDPVSFKIKKVTFRTVLRKVLADSGLTYVIQEGTIQVVTPAKARQMMVVRTYPISDIVAPNMAAQRFGPFVARAQMFNNVASLVNSIQSTVDPALWGPDGGGTITFFQPSMSLVIRAPTEFHYQLAGSGFGR